MLNIEWPIARQSSITIFLRHPVYTTVCGIENLTSRPRVSGFVFMRKHFIAPLRPYVSDENAHCSRKRLKTVSRVETFENATKPDTC